MSSITDITLKAHLQGMSGTKSAPGQQIGDKFAAALKQSIAEVNQAQLDADEASRQVAAGNSKNLHETMIKLEEAEISLKLMVQIRNKALDAYQEIMRMQV